MAVGSGTLLGSNPFPSSLTMIDTELNATADLNLFLGILVIAVKHCIR
jgi:hypothetical protein